MATKQQKDLARQLLEVHRAREDLDRRYWSLVKRANKQGLIVDRDSDNNVYVYITTHERIAP